MHRHTAPVVFKLGGSLLGLPDLRQRIEEVIRLYAPASHLWVIGGGAAADLVREWDRQFNLGDEIAHQLALEAMSLNARLVSALLPRAGLVSTLSDCEKVWSEERPAVADAAHLVTSLEATPGTALPHAWEAASDAISAWIAGRLDAERLVLLKSLDVPRAGTLGAACELVDSAFPAMCHRIRRVEWINLRASVAEPCPLQIH